MWKNTEKNEMRIETLIGIAWRQNEMIFIWHHMLPYPASVIITTGFNVCFFSRLYHSINNVLQKYGVYNVFYKKHTVQIMHILVSQQNNQAIHTLWILNAVWIIKYNICYKGKTWFSSTNSITPLSTIDPSMKPVRFQLQFSLIVIVHNPLWGKPNSFL